MIAAYLTDSIKIIRRGTLDEYGEPGTATEVDVKGLVEWGTKKVRDVNGEEAVSSASVLMEYDSALTVQDAIEISGVEHPILSIDRLRDFSTQGMRVYVA